MTVVISLLPLVMWNFPFWYLDRFKTNCPWWTYNPVGLSPRSNIIDNKKLTIFFLFIVVLQTTTDYSIEIHNKLMNQSDYILRAKTSKCVRTAIAKLYFSSECHSRFFSVYRAKIHTHISTAHSLFWKKKIVLRPIKLCVCFPTLIYNNKWITINHIFSECSLLIANLNIPQCYKILKQNIRL